MAGPENAIVYDVGFDVKGSQLLTDVSKAVRTAELSIKPIKLPSADLTNLNRGLADTKRQFNQLTESSVDFGDSLERGLRRIAALSLASAALFGIVKIFRESLQASRELEKSLQDINVVLNLPTTQLKDFGKSLFDVARQTKQSFDDVAKSALEFSRQGLSTEETLKRTEAALILVNLAGIDAAKATETITAAINSFSKENLKAIDIVNKLVAVDGNFAVSSADLAEAITRVGSVSSDVGVDFNRLIAIVTATQQVTQRGGAVIGNALKTIFQRIQRPETIQELENLGIQVREVDKETGRYTGNLLSADRILREVGERFKTLTQEQKAQTAQLVAGNLQGNVFRGILSGLTIEQEAYQTALKSSDEAIRRNSALLGTQDAKIKNLGTSLQEAGANIGKVGFGDFITKSLNGLTGQGEGSIGTTIAGNIIKSLSGTLTGGPGADVGNEFGKVFIKSFSDILLGPGLATIGVVGLKLANTLGKFTVANIKGLSPGQTFDKDLAAQQQIDKFLSGQAATINEIIKSTDSKVVQEQKILELFKLQNAALAEQTAIREATALVLTRGVGIGGLGRSRIPNAASGIGDAFSRESDAIAKGVGGASSGARPVFISDFKGPYGKGAVANTDEYLVKNYAGTGKDAIFNKDMAKKFGLPESARPISAALGVYNPSLGHDFNFPSKPSFKPKIIGQKSLDLMAAINNLDSYLERTAKETRTAKSLKTNLTKNAGANFTQDELSKLLDTGSFAGGTKLSLGELVQTASKSKNLYALKRELSTDDLDRAFNLFSKDSSEIFGHSASPEQLAKLQKGKEIFKDYKPQTFRFGGDVANFAGGFVVLGKDGVLRVRSSGGQNLGKTSQDYITAQNAISSLGKDEVLKLVRAQGKVGVEDLANTAQRIKAVNGNNALNLTNGPTQPANLPASPGPLPLASAPSSLQPIITPEIKRGFSTISTSSPGFTGGQFIPTNGVTPIGRLRPSLSTVRSVQNDIILPSPNIPNITRGPSDADRQSSGRVFTAQVKGATLLTEQRFGKEIVEASKSIASLGDASKKLAKAFEEGTISQEKFETGKKKLGDAFFKQQAILEKQQNFNGTLASTTDFKQLSKSTVLTQEQRKTLESVGNKSINDNSAGLTLSSLQKESGIEQKRIDRIAEINNKIARRASAAADATSPGFTRAFNSVGNLPLQIEKKLLNSRIGLSEERVNHLSNVGGTLAFAAPFAIEAAGSLATGGIKDDITRNRVGRGFSTAATAASTAGLVASLAPAAGVGAPVVLGVAGLLAVGGVVKGVLEGSKDNGEDIAKRQLNDANESIQRLQALQGSQGDVLRLQNLRGEGAKPDVIRGFITDALKNVNNVSSPVASSQLKELLLKPSISDKDIQDLNTTIERQSFLEEKRLTLSPSNIRTTNQKAFEQIASGEGISKEITNAISKIELTKLTDFNNPQKTSENFANRASQLELAVSTLSKDLTVGAVGRGESILGGKARARESVKQFLTPEDLQNEDVKKALEGFSGSNKEAADSLTFFETKFKILASSLRDGVKDIEQRKIADDEYQKTVNLGRLITEKRTSVELDNLKVIGKQQIAGLERENITQTQSRIQKTFGFGENQIKFREIGEQRNEIKIRAGEREQQVTQDRAGDIIKFLSAPENLERLKGNPTTNSPDAITNIIDSLNNATNLGQISDIVQKIIEGEKEVPGTDKINSFVIGLENAGRAAKLSAQELENSFKAENKRLSLIQQQDILLNRVSGTSTGIAGAIDFQKKSPFTRAGAVAFTPEEQLASAQQRSSLVNKAIDVAQGAGIEVPAALLSKQTELQNKILEKQILVTEKQLRESGINEASGGGEILDLLRQANNKSKDQLDISQNKGLIDDVKTLAQKSGANISDDIALAISKRFNNQNEKEDTARIFDLIKSGGSASIGASNPSQPLTDFVKTNVNVDFTNAKVPDIGIKVPSIEVNLNVTSDSGNIQSILGDLVEARFAEFAGNLRDQISSLKLELTSSNDKFDYKIAEIQKDTGTAIIPKSFQLNFSDENANK